jgi:pilus assembly protein CpaF
MANVSEWYQDIQEYLGPVTELLCDPTVTEIMLNPVSCGTIAEVFVERHGRKQALSGVTVKRIAVDAIARRVATSHEHNLNEDPICYGRFADGCRVTVMMPPISPVGTAISIRKFRRQLFSLDEMIGNGTVTAELAAHLSGCVERRDNILISGGTDAGKTTFLNVLSLLITSDQRIVSIEKPREIQLHHRNRIELEATSKVSMRKLTQAAMRLNPDRIIFGEVRGIEAVDMLAALNSGHAGSLCTIHANSPLLALSKLTNYALEAAEKSYVPIRREIADCIQIVVQLEKDQEGRRHVTEVIRVSGYNVQKDEFVTEPVRSATTV